MRDDLKTNLVVDTAGNSIKPQTATSTVTGGGVDMSNADGMCAAFQNVGTVSGTSPTLNTKVQESSDNSTYTDIAGAVFTQVTASNKGEMINFKRTKQWVRLVGTIAGTSPSFALSAQVLGVKKSV